MLTMILLATAPASANPHNSVSVLVGSSTAFDNDPASLRLSLRGEVGLDHDENFGVAVLVPFTISSYGEDSLGFSSNQTVFEVPVSVRGQLLPHSKLRFNADAGAGIAIGTSRFSGWFIDSSSSATALMTRLALGLEVGPPGGVSLVVEPLEVRTFFANDRARSAYSMMVGLTVPI